MARWAVGLGHLQVFETVLHVDLRFRRVLRVLSGFVSAFHRGCWSRFRAWLAGCWVEGLKFGVGVAIRGVHDIETEPNKKSSECMGVAIHVRASCVRVRIF